MKNMYEEALKKNVNNLFIYLEISLYGINSYLGMDNIFACSF